MDWMTFGDRMLHVLTASISVVLLIVSKRAYLTRQDSKFLYVSTAFGFFFLKEVLLLSQSIMGDWWIIDFSAHVLNFIILACFFRGTVK